MSGAGLFISFEGIDGSGKSTQARILAEDLREKGREVVLTREPGGSAGAEEIRRLVLTGAGDRWSPETEVLLFTAARRDHLERVIAPALDRGAAHLKDELMPRYAELIYNGFWFSPEREMLQALIDRSQEHVEGEVRLKLYKGRADVVGRRSPKSLYSMAHVTFEEDVVYDQRDAEGFIKLNALRLRLAQRRGRN